MTAANAFARDHGAYLMADTGGYAHDGRLMETRSKIHASGMLAMGLVLSGRHESNAGQEVTNWLAWQPSQVQALTNLPALLRLLADHDAEASTSGLNGDVGAIPQGVRLTVAWWDSKAETGRAAILSSIGDVGAEPFAPRPVKTMFSPPLSDDPWPGHTFDPRTDAARLADLQRAEVDGMGVHRVGGAFECVRISPAGIERDVVVDWRDRLGVPIRVALTADAIDDSLIDAYL